METPSGARTPLVDPFGRELEEWLRDAPATRAPYLADLVVPPVTGPVQRPVRAASASESVEGATRSDRSTPEQVADGQVADTEQTVDGQVADTEQTATAFRRARDRARHAAACAPSFPEPPERLALRFEDLAVEVSAASGRTTIERIVLLEDEVRRRDEDLARLAAWEATVAGLDDPEVDGARAFAASVFADLLADAARESDRRDRAAARRAATPPIATAPSAARTHARGIPTATTAPAVVLPALVEATDVADAIDAVEPTTPFRDGPVRPVLSLPAVSPVSANTRPTPLVQPATGPTVIDRAAFAAALTAHTGVTASTPVVLPEAVALPAQRDETASGERGTDGAAAEQAVSDDATGERRGWWARLVARILRTFGRR